MIQFDRLKLVSTLESLEILEENAFETKVKDGQICSLKYHQEAPFLLDIKIDYEDREVVIEFSGKVLLEDYPELISMNTIERCFEHINSLGICALNFEEMMDAEVVSCDVTKDVRCDDVPTLTEYLKCHVKNFNAYLPKLTKTKNLTVEKNVITRKCKKRMIVYDKGREMASALNKQFVEDNHLEGKFDGIARFELNLNSKEQIRQALNITSTKLRDVLRSSATPISSFVEVAFDTNVNESSVGDWALYKTMCVLKVNDYDIEKVEAMVRSMCKRGTKISEVMRPYREALEQIRSSEVVSEYVRNILDQLKECQNNDDAK